MCQAFENANPSNGRREYRQYATVTGNFAQDGFLRVTLSTRAHRARFQLTVQRAMTMACGSMSHPGSIKVCFGPATGYAKTPACQSVNMPGGNAS